MLCAIIFQGNYRMQDTQENSANSPEVKKPVVQQRPVRQQQQTLSGKIFNLILRLKDTRFFQWVNKNYVLSLVIVSVWGMVIVGTFLFYVIYTVLQQTEGQ